MKSLFYESIRSRLKDLNLADYQQSELLNFCYYDCGFENKDVVELGSDLELNTAKGIRKLGAKKVLCINPDFPDSLISNDARIVVSKRDGADTGLPDNSVDVVFGFALLEHVHEPRKIVEEIKRILKPQGIAYLEGCPIWSGPVGHHVWHRFPDEFYKFSDETNPFSMWEHLYYDTEEQIENALRSKGLPEIHSKSIADFIINSTFISRKKASDIIREVSSVEGLEINIRTSPMENQVVPEDLLDKYSMEDLDTYKMRIRIRKW
jgi:SAM-dependent methyltransferase